MLLIDIGYDLVLKDNLDYAVTFLGYGVKETRVNHKRNIQISLAFSESFSHSIKRLAAIDEFIKTKAYVSIMQNKKRNEIDRELRPRLIEALLKAKVTYQGKVYGLGEDLGVSADVSSEIFSQIKQRILNEEFTKEFSKYPKLRSKLSSENIRGTIESILRDISQRQQGVLQDLLTQSTNILLPLGLYKDNRIDTTESEYAKIVLDKLDDGKNISMQELMSEFSKKPFGLQNELTQLILAVLLRNGDIILSSRRGNLYSASDFSTLFSSGLKAFEDLSYVKKEEDLNVSKVQMLFDAIDEDKSLLQTQRDRPEAYRKYIEKIERIQRDTKEIGEDFERLKQSIDIGIPAEDINGKIQEIEKIDFSKLRIKSIVEFKKLDYSPERITQIKQGYETIQKLKSFFNDYFTYIQSDINYMRNVSECVKSDFFKTSESEQLLKIYDDSKAIIANIKKLLKNDEREPLNRRSHETAENLQEQNGRNAQDKPHADQPAARPEERYHAPQLATRSCNRRQARLDRTNLAPYFSFISNPSGSSSLKVMVRVPSATGNSTGAPGSINSASTCRHAPQGGLACPFKFATATATIRICGPNCETARTSAARSAQIVSP